MTCSTPDRCIPALLSGLAGDMRDISFCCCAQIRDDNGAEISSKICNIIGADGGSMPYARDHPWPSTGMMTDVAYRWDVVCDFSSYTGRVCSCIGCAVCHVLTPDGRWLHLCSASERGILMAAASAFDSAI